METLSHYIRGVRALVIHSLFTLEPEHPGRESNSLQSPYCDLDCIDGAKHPSSPQNYSVEHLKGDWKKLHDCYRQAMLRVKTKSGDSVKKMKSWKYEELTSFLLSDLTPQKAYSNVNNGHYSEENKDDLGPMNAENQNGKGEEQVEAEFAKNRESESQNRRKYIQEDDVDKILTFMQKNKDKRQESLIYSLPCGGTKRIPCCLQLRVKQEIIKAIINAETEYLDHPVYAQTSTPIFASQILKPSPAYSEASITLPGSRISTPSPAYHQTPTPLPDYGQNQVQDSTPNRMY